jgi:hypothetical protein
VAGAARRDHGPNRADPIEENDPMSVPHPPKAAPPGTDRRFDRYQPRPAGWVLGMSVFAAIAMIMIGFFHVVEGLAAFFDNDIYLVGPRYVFSFDETAWGWIHLLVGVLLMAAGFAIRTGRLWVRSVGIAFASLSMIANFLFIPYYPAWSLLIIVLDFFVIWALCLFTGYGSQD